MRASAAAVFVTLFVGSAVCAAVTNPNGPRNAQHQAEQKSPVELLVAAAIDGDRARVGEIALRIKAQARLPRGNRHKARDLNEHGLALWQRSRYNEAAAYFRQAREADPGDAEIAENLGYSLIKSGHVAEAEQPILDALSMAPDRASAWGSLGMIYAKQGKHRQGVALVLTAYSYARDPKRTAGVYSRLAASDEDPKVRAMLAEVVSKLPGT
ncbi:MAG TPA: tetratricopeptide repeat protein [Burkholderiales bacterium]|nr:tetratricopeptide repeat protein [Burkholderiales bacterium]